MGPLNIKINRVLFIVTCSANEPTTVGVASPVAPAGSAVSPISADASKILE
jgi:hypothetical protein